jgi:hypothetical protein
MDKLYNMLDGLDADAICDALVTMGTCAGLKCDDCPFKSNEVLKQELKGMEEL